MPSIRDSSRSPRTRPRNTATRSRCSGRRRKGAVLILFALLLVVLLGMLAFAVDIGVNVHHRASLHNAVDAAALAAAGVLERGNGGVNNHQARVTGAQYFELNGPDVKPRIQLGRWDPLTRIFDTGLGPELNANAVRVTAEWEYSSFFGRVLARLLPKFWVEIDIATQPRGA